MKYDRWKEVPKPANTATWWRRTGYSGEIEPVAVVKETDKCLYVWTERTWRNDGKGVISRELKRTHYTRYFATKAEAQGFNQQKMVEQLKRLLADMRYDADNAAKLSFRIEQSTGNLNYSI